MKLFGNPMKNTILPTAVQSSRDVVFVVYPKVKRKGEVGYVDYCV